MKDEESEVFESSWGVGFLFLILNNKESDIFLKCIGQ